jgi:hypothetical protein
LNIKEKVMNRFWTRAIQSGLLGLLISAGVTTASHAENGTVRVVFTKGGFIVGVGGGHGVLTFRGHHYRFRVSGASIGAIIGASTSHLSGRALNLNGPGDLAGTYSVIGAGAALAAGAGGVALQNGNGVILELAGGRVGVELSASVGGVTIRML